MIGMSVTVTPEFKRVEKAADKAQFRNFGHASAAIRKDAAQSIEKAVGPSAPGAPPHTHRRVFLRRALRFFVDKQKGDAIIGPRKSIVGDVGQVLEFGGERGDSKHPARPFMYPALERQAPRFAQDWAGTIGE